MEISREEKLAKERLRWKIRYAKYGKLYRERYRTRLRTDEEFRKRTYERNKRHSSSQTGLAKDRERKRGYYADPKRKKISENWPSKATIDQDYEGSQKYPQQETEEIPQELSTGLLKNLDLESSRSTDLLTSSANQLHKRLLLMLPEQTNETMRVMDIHTVDVACKVAAQITNLMRLKLDVLKFSKSLQE